MKIATILGMIMATGLLNGCAIHSTSRDWNGLMGSSGEPTYYKSTSKVALKLVVVIPFLGDVSIDGLIDDVTENIAEENGDRVRIVQADAENYWYGFPPFTWIITPVVCTVAAEYLPEEESYQKDQQAISEKKKGWHKYNPMDL
jgi:hypothetical protein